MRIADRIVKAPERSPARGQAERWRRAQDPASLRSPNAVHGGAPGGDRSEASHRASAVPRHVA